MNRREFFKRTGASIAAGTLLGANVLGAETKNEDGQKELLGKILNYNPNMQYRLMGRTGVKVSALGFGMLRLPILSDGKVDFDQSVAMVRRAVEGGVNYIDTGRVYLNGQSEQVVGEALSGGLRDRVYVTSKSPWWIMEQPEGN